jgi:23S rRNA pseudouridine1911/1915/1917 synthase
MAALSFAVSPDEAGRTLAALLRPRLPNQSWAQIKRVIATGHVFIGGDVCLDPARRLQADEAVEVRERAAPRQPQPTESVLIRHLDRDLVVVEKPSGIATVRHPAERELSSLRKAINPTLDEIVLTQIAARSQGRERRLRIVHRLDKATSGLLVFARTVLAERELGRQFHRHTVIRRYLAIISGYLPGQRIATRLVRDRGDRRRGGTRSSGEGKEAVTHVELVERLGGYTLLSCRLETGRTHQIRIHLAELGHPICGEAVYNRPLGAQPLHDRSSAPRLALHAGELGFTHPTSGRDMHWIMDLPSDLQSFLAKLRKSTRSS